jgi:hypothetical protein
MPLSRQEPGPRLLAAPASGQGLWMDLRVNDERPAAVTLGGMAFFGERGRLVRAARPARDAPLPRLGDGLTRSTGPFTRAVVQSTDGVP